MGNDHDLTIHISIDHQFTSYVWIKSIVTTSLVNTGINQSIASLDMCSPNYQINDCF